MWQLAEHLHDISAEERSIVVYTVDMEVTAAFSFVLSFVIAEYISFVVQRYDHRLSVCIDTAEASLQVALEVAVLFRGYRETARRLVRYVVLIVHVYCKLLRARRAPRISPSARSESVLTHPSLSALANRFDP